MIYFIGLLAVAIGCFTVMALAMHWINLREYGRNYWLPPNQR
jgi:uncharacterized membrane protein YedE/YeeE